ncbi:MAG: GDSL-type esterase/lipase family protein [Vicinamibacterales bacterium]
MTAPTTPGTAPPGARSPAEPASLAVRVAASLFAVLVTLLVLEAGLRLVGYSDDPLSIQVSDANDARAYHLFEDANFEYDPQLIWRPRPGESVFNRQGFRGPVLATPKPAGQLRIFTVGDSNTLGWAGEDGANWPAALQGRVRSVRPDAVVVNAGVWGYASYQGLVRFRETLAFDPDIVLVSFGSNDAHQVLEPDRAYARRPMRTTDADRFLRRFRLGQLVLSVLENPTPGEAPHLQPRVSLDEYRENLATMVREGRDHGARVVLLTRPYVGAITGPEWWKNWGADYAAATLEVGDQLDAPVIDVYSVFRDRDDLFADESHFTDEGHALAAGVILEGLRPYLQGR